MLEIESSKDIMADKFLRQIWMEITKVCKDTDEITVKKEDREVLEKKFDLIVLQELVVKTRIR